MATAVQAVNQWTIITPRFNVPDWYLGAVRTLERFSLLEDNWDGYGSPRISEPVSESACKALLLVASVDLPQPGIYPVSGGGISIEWESDAASLDIEITPEGERVCLIDDEFRDAQDDNDLKEIARQFLVRVQTARTVA